MTTVQAHRRIRREIVAEANTAPYSLVFTSLTIILLSFFIQLTAGRRIEPRQADLILQSTQQHFGATRRMSSAANRARSVSAVLWGFESHEDQPVSPKMAQLSISSAAVFLAQSDQIAARMIPLLQTAVAKLRSKSLPVRITYSLGVKEALPGNGMGSDPGILQWDLLAARGAALSRYLLDSGVSADAFEIESSLDTTGDGELQIHAGAQESQ